MKKLGYILLLALLIAAALTVGALASGEPSAEPSGEPAAVPPAAEANDAVRLPVTIVVNGDTYKEATVAMSRDGNRYTFEIAELLEAFGAELDYDEQTDTAVLRPTGDGLAAAAVQSMTAAQLWGRAGETGGDADDAPSGEPSAAGPDAEASADAASAAPAAAPSVRAMPTSGQARAFRALHAASQRRNGWRTA